MNTFVSLIDEWTNICRSEGKEGGPKLANQFQMKYVSGMLFAWNRYTSAIKIISHNIRMYSTEGHLLLIPLQRANLYK